MLSDIMVNMQFSYFLRERPVQRENATDALLDKSSPGVAAGVVAVHAPVVTRYSLKRVGA